MKKKTKIKPFGERFLVKRLLADETSKGGIIIPEKAREKPQKGQIVKVGTFVSKEKNIPVGTVVIFTGYAGTELKVDGEYYLILLPDEIIAIEES